MRRYVRWFIALALLLPVNLGAQQDATVQGAVVDASQGVLPGASMTATGSRGTQTTAVTTRPDDSRSTIWRPGHYNSPRGAARIRHTRNTLTSTSSSGRT